MPTHGRPDVLGFAIASVLAQTEADFELLIVIDGGDPRTRGVIDAFSDPRIRVFDLPKGRGFGYANRNVALREARGHFLAIAAHDDLLFADHLALLSALLLRKGCDLGYSRPLWVSTDGVIVPFGTNLDLADERQHFIERENTVPSSAFLTTRAAAVAAGLWPEDVDKAGDWVLWRRILAAGDNRVAYLRQPTMLHFSADWKRSRFAAMEEMRRLLEIADGAAWWPRILRASPSGLPEQARIWLSLSTGGETYRDSLRDAVDVVADRIAWDVACGKALVPDGAHASAGGGLDPHVLAAWGGLRPGALAGCVDSVQANDGSGRLHVSGWAMDTDHPDLPVPLNICVGDRVIATTMADRFRSDLREAGIGHGRCAFRVTLPAGLAPGEAASVEVRRGLDGAAVPRPAS